jgi:beta-phosphoglucomutase-like phosphatase (HAD superfamily)
VTTLSASSCDYEFALLFDCDGVILEMEELHGLVYNEAFDASRLTIDGEPVIWSVDYDDVLQNLIGGGKPKMNFHFRNTTGKSPMDGTNPASSIPKEDTKLIDYLQTHKKAIFTSLNKEKVAAHRRIFELIDEALAVTQQRQNHCTPQNF